MSGGSTSVVESSVHGRCVLVTGAAGQLGGSLFPVLSWAWALPIGSGSRVAPRADVVLGITDVNAVTATRGAVRPDAVVRAVARTDVDGCERVSARVETVYAVGTKGDLKA